VRTTDPIPIASVFPTSASTSTSAHCHTRTTIDQGGSGRSSYAAVRGPNRGIVITSNTTILLSLYVVNGIHPSHVLKIVLSPSTPPTHRYWSQNYPTSHSSNDLRRPDTQRVRKRQHNRRYELTRPTVVPPNGGNQPTRVPNPASVGHPHVRVIAGTGEVAVGDEEAMGEVPRGKIQLHHHRTPPSPPPSSWLTLQLLPIPQQNPPRSPSQIPGRSLPEDILRRCRRTRFLFPLKRARGPRTGERDLNKGDHRQPHRTLRANSLAFKR